MVILPGCKCCKPCPSDDSDGEGTFFEDFFEYDDAAAATAAGWGGNFADTASFAGGSVIITNEYMGRCTYIDLSRDALIEIEVDASSIGSGSTGNTGTNAIYGFESGISAFAGPDFSSGARISGSHDPLGGNSGADYVRLIDFPLYPIDDPDTRFFGGSSLSYRLAILYVDGAWTATYQINGTTICTDEPCVAFSLPDNRFHHGFFGNDESKTIVRYYMKLTYL